MMTLQSVKVKFLKNKETAECLTTKESGFKITTEHLLNVHIKFTYGT